MFGLPIWVMSFLSGIAGSLWNNAQVWITKFFTEKMFGKFIIMQLQARYSKEKARALKTPDKDDDEYLKDYVKFIRFGAELLDVNISEWQP